MTEDTKKVIYSMIQVGRTHGSRQVLKDISLSYFYGAKIGVLGLNGSGKSTLALVVAGHSEYAVTDGSVTYKGKDLLQLEPEERAREGIFLGFQYPEEIPGVSVVNFLRFPREGNSA